MNKEEILSGNKMIAEFMGWEYREGLFDEPHFNLLNDGKLIDRKLQSKIKYNSSWDWLIPVVEKIEKGNYGFKMCRKVVEVYLDDSKELLFKVKESSRIESLWYAVVEFINWEKNNKK